MARPTGNPTTPIPIRIDADLRAKIKEAAELTGLSDVDIIRLCTQIGLVHLRRIDYKIPEAIHDQSADRSNAYRDDPEVQSTFSANEKLERYGEKRKTPKK